jgi:hypothetical protein
MAATTFIAARNFNAKVDLGLSVSDPVQEAFGERHSITFDGKQVVVVFPDCEVKPCISKGRPLLIMELWKDSPQPQVLATLEELRTRFAEQLKVEVSLFRPILTPGKGLLGKSSSLFLNVLPKAALTDLKKQTVEYQSLVNRKCKMLLYVHMASVFKSEKDGLYTLQFKVSQMAVQEKPSVDVHVEAVDVGLCTEDPSLML